MWGNPAHISELERIARETYSGAESDGTVLHVLKAESIRDDSTYDGVDWGGERLAKEVCLLNLRAGNGLFWTNPRLGTASRIWNAKETMSFASLLLDTVWAAWLLDI